MKKTKKYFIGYLYNDNKIESLHIMLPKTNAYVKGCDGQTKLMYFLKEFDSESSYNKEYLKTKK